MAFKSIQTYNEERYGGFFRLVNDNDSADVIFLYRGVQDVLVGDVHYIKSADYSGYVHCCGRGCPACGKGIRVQPKLFIPLYNLTTNQIEFWDRAVSFETQLKADVFNKFPNPSEFVFRITRHGVPRDLNTKYDISVIGRNSQEPYDEILKRFNITMPDHYETICKSVESNDLYTMLTASDSVSSASSDLPDYSVTPRTTTSSMVPPVYEPVPSESMLPTDTSDGDDGEGDDDIDDVKF